MSSIDKRKKKIQIKVERREKKKNDRERQGVRGTRRYRGGEEEMVTQSEAKGENINTINKETNKSIERD